MPPEQRADTNPVFDPGNPQGIGYYFAQIDELVREVVPDMAPEKRRKMKKLLLDEAELINYRNHTIFKKSDEKLEDKKVKKDEFSRSMLERIEKTIIDLRSKCKKDKSLKVHCETACAQFSQLLLKIEKDLLQSDINRLRTKNHKMTLDMEQKKLQMKTIARNTRLELSKQYHELSDEPVPKGLESIIFSSN